MAEKIHCALCIHCKVFKISNDRGRTYIRKLRCAMGKWRNARGAESTYDFHALSRRLVAECEFYETDECGRADGEVLSDIFRALPDARVIYRGGAR